MPSLPRKLRSQRFVPAVVIAGLLCVAASRLGGQSRGNTVGGLPIPNPQALPDDNSTVAAPFPPALLESARKAFKEERWQRMNADTKRLVALTAEVRGDAARMDQNASAVALMKKIEAIEKLAHGVRDKAKVQ